MSRSLKKGPFIDVKLEKRILAMNETLLHDFSGFRRAYSSCTQR